MTGPGTQRAGSSLWRHRDFLLLWGGQSVSELGSAVTLLALPLTAVVALRASTFQVGALTSAVNAAFLIVALPAGAVVDRLAKRRLMVWCDAARMLVIGSIPVTAALGVLSMAQLYAVALVSGLGTVFFDVAYQSYLPELIGREHLVDGNGKLQTTAEGARLAGPGLGGALVGLVGAATAMAADAASFAVSVASLLLIRARATAPEPVPVAAPRPRLRTEVMAGLSFVRREPILRKIVACTGTSNLFGGVTIALEIIFLVRVLHVPPAYTGLVVALSAVGGIAGGILSGRLARWFGSARIIWVSILGFGAGGILVPFATPGWGVALFVLGWGSFSFSGVVYNVAQVSYRQAVCPPELLGRMNAAVRWIVWGTIPLGGLLGGALGSMLGVRPALAVGAIGGWAGGLWVFFSPLRRMRDVPPPGTYPPPAGQPSPVTPAGAAPEPAPET